MNALSLRHDPVRLVLSRAPWAAAWYLLGYLFTGTVLFAVVLTAVALGVSLSFTLAGLPVLVAAAVLVRWCANVERARLGTVAGEPVEGRYRAMAGSGVVAQLRTRWRDPATWRDIAYLLGLYGPLLALDSAVLCIWLTLLAGITAPAWYARVSNICVGYCPAGAKGIQLGSFHVDSLHSALLLAAICLVAFLLFSYVVVGTVRVHVSLARALLRAPADPLREARELLRRPGPLAATRPNGQT